MKDIETLRKFFRVSNAAFTFSDAVVSALKEMEQLAEKNAKS